MAKGGEQEERGPPDGWIWTPEVSVCEHGRAHAEVAPKYDYECDRECGYGSKRPGGLEQTYWGRSRGRKRGRAGRRREAPSRVELDARGFGLRIWPRACRGRPKIRLRVRPGVRLRV